MSSDQYRPKAGPTRRDTVEQLLNEVPGAEPAEADALMALFATVAGPVRSGELAGEAAAAAAFRAALRPPAPATGGAKMRRSRAALLSVKTAAAALALTSMGGVALAATTGVLPTPLTSHPANPSTGNAVRGAATDVTVGGPAKAAAVREAAKAAAAADRTNDIAGSDRSASYAGLCQAFAAGAWDNGKAAGSPAFARLIAAAPQANVAEFCTALAQEDAAGEDTSPAGAATANRKSATHENAAKKSKTGQEHRDAGAGKAMVGKKRSKAGAGDAAAGKKASEAGAGHAAVGKNRGKVGAGTGEAGAASTS